MSPTTNGNDRDGDGVPNVTDSCPDKAAKTPDGCPPTTNGNDRDGDGVPNATDNCPDKAAKTPDGCPPTTNGNDRDGDGVPNVTDGCPDKAAKTADGCPPTTNDNDRDGDGVPNATDNCPDTPNPGQDDNDGDGIGDACDRLRAIPALIKEFDTGCTDQAVRRTLEKDVATCEAVATVAGVRSDDSGERAQAVLAALRQTRTRAAKSGGRLEPVGVSVSFEVTLEGFSGRRVDVSWSLYRARGGGRVPYSWLINHPVLQLTGEAENDTASKEFWVPLPKKRQRFFVRISVLTQNGTKLTFKDTRSFL